MTSSKVRINLAKFAGAALVAGSGADGHHRPFSSGPWPIKDIGQLALSGFPPTEALREYAEFSPADETAFEAPAA
jgi:hypothetical protein